MDPHTVFCPNHACPARGQIGEGNITVHSRQERRYICNTCEKTFAETTGTAFYRLRTPRETIVLVLALLAHGCPVQAIVVAFGLDERTVISWQERAGEHCEQVHQHLVEQPRDLGQVQADEIRAKVQGGILWLAMAIQVSTRLWLGGVLSAQRDMRLIVALIEKVKAAALCRPLLICTDGCRAYLRAIRVVFREPVSLGQTGRPRLRPWDNLCIGQVVKRYIKKQVVAVERRVVQGTEAHVVGLLKLTQGGGQVNTAFIERLKATFRSRIAALVRRTRALARQTDTLRHAM